MRIRIKCLFIKWMQVFSIVSISLMIYNLRTKERLDVHDSDGTHVQTHIWETVEKLARTVVIAAQQRVNTEFISLVNIFQGDDYMNRSNGPFATNVDITWCSFCDEKNLHYVRTIAAFWDGPVSIAVFTYGSKIPYALRYLSALRHCDANVKQKVKFHLCIPEAEVGPIVKYITDGPQTTHMTCDMLQLPVDGAVANYADKKFPFPVNYLRNVALKNANTSHIINVDIDFTPSKNLYNIFLNFVTGFGKTVKPKTAFILPCFESNTSMEMPITRYGLLQRWKGGTVRPYYENTKCTGCQKPTDYTRWRALKVTHKHTLSLAYYLEMKRFWEPYIITRKDQVPYFDERFRGFGYNRVSQICEMYMSGYEFAVVDNGFVIHDGFKEDEPTGVKQMREKSNIMNKLLFGDMKRELQGRYPNKMSNKC